MSEVKRYDVVHSEFLGGGIGRKDNGKYCLYADYAALKEQFDFKQNLTEQVVALQKQCDALAAEAGYLRGEIKQHGESVHFCEVCGKDDPCKNDDVCWSLNHPTPATDSYLNSVRAEGVEMAISSAFSDGIPVNRMQFIKRMSEFAANLRKENGND